MKDGKRFASWIGGKARSGAESIGKRVQGFQEKRKAQGFIRKQELEQIREAREEARFKGELAGARRVGYREGLRKAQQPSRLTRFADTLGSMSKGLSETFQVDPSFYGVGSARRSTSRRKKRKRRR